MGFDDIPSNPRRPNQSFTLDDLLTASRAGLLRQPVSKRRREKLKRKKKALQAGLVLPLLAAEGCLSLGKKDLALVGDESAAGDSEGATEKNSEDSGGVDIDVPLDAQDDHFHVGAETETVNIPASTLLANDVHDNSGPLEIVRVFNAVNGSVFFDGAIVEFVPDEGFTGDASFQYEVRGADGTLSIAEVVLHIGDEAAHGTDQSGDHHGGHDDGNHDDGSSSDGGHVHPDDPAKASEHVALLSLVPVDEATHIAVNSGSWFDPATWASGEVPGDGAKVVIPEGVHVAYDGESDVSLFTVRVDGMLEFATDQNTFMEVDTLIVAPTGHLTIGTIDNPVAAHVNAIIQIADNGPIDVAWDTQLMSRGVISHGTIDVHGAEKDTFLKVAIDAMAGDTSLTLESAPDGWQVGDRLVLTGTHLAEFTGAEGGTPLDIETEDEELIITSIEGNVIHFDRPLQYDHDTPRDDLNAYVANYSRNVQILTENYEDVPVHQRGHVMLMHSDNIDVRYAEFFELGRTDKSERAFDVAELDSVESDTNIKARYSLHIHRAGVADQDDPAMLVGNAVWGSPGWGYVHHDSNAHLIDNAAYDVYGAAFVAETGNETGRWAHNIAIKSIGVAGGAHGSPKVQEDIIAFDLGRTGAGFWFQSRIVDAVDNVAAGIPSGQGFVYFSRGATDSLIAVLPETAPQPETLRYQDSAFIDKPAISQFYGNETIASGTGLSVIKQDPSQGHDDRTIIEGFTAWEVKFGVHLEYTARYTLLDLDVIGADGALAGVSLGTLSRDIVVNGANIAGFDTGVFFNSRELSAGDQGYIVIDANISGAINEFENRTAHDLVLSGSDLNTDRLFFTSDQSGIADAYGNPDGLFVELSGIKSDSIGDVQISSDWDPQRFDLFSLRGALEQEGYWTLPDGTPVVIVEQYITDRATGEQIKIGTPVAYGEPDFDFDPNRLARDGSPDYNGVLDLNSAAPVGTDDHAIVQENGSVVIDVLANDFDPDGDSLRVDGLTEAIHGDVYLNEDGTLTYVPDANYVGGDEFSYWVEDDHGNFTKTDVFVTVEV